MVGVLLRSACGAVESVHLSICLSVHHQGFAGEGGAVLGGRPCGEEEEAGTKTQSRGTITSFLEAEKMPGSLPSSSSVCSGQTKPLPPVPTQHPGIRKKLNFYFLPLSSEPGSSSALALLLSSPFMAVSVHG